MELDEVRSTRHAPSMVDRVTAHIRAHIAANRLRPGDVLPGEAEISRELKVSRPVVREAWNGLSALGVLDVAPGRKPRVAHMIGLPMRSVMELAVSTGQATPLQVLELRRGIELQMVGLAAERREAGILAAMGSTIASMGACLDDHARYADLDAQFHLQIARACANPFHVLLVEACMDAFRQSMLAGLASRIKVSQLRRLHTNHVDIYDAIAARNVAQAVSLMSAHFDDAEQALARREGR